MADAPVELRPSLGDDDESFLNVREEVEERRSRRAAVVEAVGRGLARPWLFGALTLAVLVWVLSNVRPLVPWPAWDPHPFTLLATVFSVLAPFVSLLILMRQQRDARIAELREELQLQVLLDQDRRLAALARMVGALEERVGADDAIDRETRRRLDRPVEDEALLDRVRRKLDRIEGEED